MNSSHIYLFMFGCAGSLLLCRLSLVVVSRGYSAVVEYALVIALASLVKHRLQGMQASVAAAHGLSSCIVQTLQHGLNSSA